MAGNAQGRLFCDGCRSSDRLNGDKTYRIPLALMIISLGVHAYTFIPERQIDSAWIPIALTATFFFTFIPILRILKPIYDDGYKFDMWERALEGGPKWVPPVMIILLAYTGFNFFFSLIYLNEGLTPLSTYGSYFMMNKGKVIRAISEAEYYRHRAYEFRGITTHPILFHALVAAVMYANSQRKANSP